MKIHDGTDNFERLKHAVVTSGTFDGVHVGHQKIIQRLKTTANNVGGETVVLTYWPHPRFVLHKDDDSLKLLSTFEEKAKLLADHGIDHLVKIPFTKEFASQSSEEFIQNILIERIGTKHLVIGYDHRFGKNREGSFEHLVEHKQRYGFEVEEIPKQEVDEVGVSSTRIRNALANGEVEIAANYLGRPYSFAGKVVKGEQIGRKIGYPTANIQIPESYKLIPARGVYAAEVKYLDKKYRGMLSIGVRPTVGNNLSQTLEIHIFDFTQEIYGDWLTVEVCKFLRPEEKLDSLAELKAKIEKDEKQTRKFFNSKKV